MCVKVGQFSTCWDKIGTITVCIFNILYKTTGSLTNALVQSHHKRLLEVMLQAHR